MHAATLTPSTATRSRWDIRYEWKAVTLLCLGFGLVGIDRFMGLPLFPVISQELHLNYQDLGQITGVLSIAWGLASIFMGNLSDRLGRKPVMILSVIGAGIGLYFLMHTGAEPYRLFGSLFATLFFVFSMICLTVGPISAEAVPAKLMTTASGIVVGTGEIFGGGIAPVIAGYVAQHYGIQYILHLAALVLGFVVVLFLQETAPSKR